MEKAEYEIKVHISSQTLQLYKNEFLIKSYPVSTAKNGIGNESGSNKTPLGLHQICEKIGADAKLGTIFKAGINTGRRAVINGENPDDDLITTRILKIKGLEDGLNYGDNVDSFRRGIWIHGTPEEKRIGTPASHGCIRMNNKDISELYDLVQEEVIVRIMV